MTIKSNVKAGGIRLNHNEGMAVRTDVKAGLGGTYYNHNETMR